MCAHLGWGRKSRASAQQHRDLLMSAELGHGLILTLLLAQGIQGKHREREAAGSTARTPKSHLTDTHWPGFHCNNCSSPQARTEIKMTQSRLSVCGTGHTESTGTSHLTGRQQQQHTAKHSEGALSLLRLFISPTSQKIPQHTKHKNECHYFFHLPKRIEEFHSCNGN